MIKLMVKNTSDLKNYIAMSGYTVTSLANDIGVTKNYLSTIIHCNSHPSPKLAQSIVKSINDRLGTDYKISDIFFGK